MDLKDPGPIPSQRDFFHLIFLNEPNDEEQQEQEQEQEREQEQEWEQEQLK